MARVAIYRILVAARLHPVQSLRAEIPQGMFFHERCPDTAIRHASRFWLHNARYFGWFRQSLDGDKPVDWHRNPFTRQQLPMLNWWMIPDFDGSKGDVKAVWEASRFDWVVAMAERSLAGVDSEGARLNRWLSDWCDKNPPFVGANWKCGQEAAIRVLHLAIAALILEKQREPTPAMAALVRVHLRRIVPTINYAIGQDNNHGTSEAAALFIGGSLLLQHHDADGERYMYRGRRLLESRVRRLIESDGTFSQYSVNYQRMVVDTLSIVECWRRSLLLDPLSGEFYFKARRAAEWLFTMVEPDSGDAPNIGANDGTQLLQFGNAEYRDFRPSVQLAMALFAECRAYEGEHGENVFLERMRVSTPPFPAPLPAYSQFDHGGFAVIRSGPWMSVLRYPRYRFRPGQADALHIDLWLNGDNILRDAGTYSYCVSGTVLDAFQGVAGHNTIQFDGRDQMPRVGRFLFGNWLNARSASPIREHATGYELTAGYRDWLGAEHERTLRLQEHGATVEDCISGFVSQAVMRWRLLPGDWQVAGTTVIEKRSGIVLAVAATMPIERFELMVGEESRYYLQKSPVPILEITVERLGVITTQITFHDS